MKQVISLILIYCVLITSAFGQSVNPNDQLKIGKGASSTDKGIVFDTNDGASNKKLLIEKISKKLKFDGNAVQIGDGSPTSDKEIIVAGALKSLKYNGTSGEFEFDDDLKLSGELKSDILRAINTEVAVKSLLRAELGIKIGTGAHEIRVSGGNLEFSNDGSLYKKLGSGTGSGGSSGISILENASFEDGITTGWTSSGGTFSQETYTNSVEGSTKYARFVATGAGQYFETTLKAIPDNFSGGCQADFKKVNVSANDLFKVEVLDSSSNVLTFGNVKKSSWVKFPTINFTCPASGATVKLRLTSLAAGTIEVDDAYLGSNQNVISGSTIIESESAIYVGYTSKTSNLVKFASKDSTRSNNSKIISDDNSGTYTKYTLLKDANVTVVYALEHGVARSNTVIFHYNSSNSLIRKSQGFYTDSGSTGGANNVTYTTFAKAGDYFMVSDDVATPTNSTTATWFSITAVSGNQNETAVSPEQSSWFIDANIGGGNANLGTASQSSYTEIIGTSLDLVNNISKGSAHVEIACANGFPSIGNTCGANNESVGIAFIPPSSGLYEACFAFSHNTNSANGMTSYFQVIETTNTSSAIVSEGGQRIGGGHGNAISTISPQKVCGFFNFSDTSKKTLRLMYEQNATSGTVSSLMADRSSGDGQRDINVTVRPLLSAYNRPILTGEQVTRPGSSNIVEYDFVVDSAGGVSNLYGGNLVSSCTNASPHVCTFNAGKFIGQVECFVNIKTAGTYSGQAHTTSSSGTSISAWNSTTGSSVNSISSKAVRCVGQRP